MCSPSPAKTGTADISVSTMVTSGTSASRLVNVRLDAICKQWSWSKRRNTCARNRTSCRGVELMERILRERARVVDSALRVDPLHLVLKPVQGVDVGFCRGHDDIRVGPHAIDDPAALRQAPGPLPLRLGSLGDLVDRVKQQLRAARREGLDGLEGLVPRTVAFGCRRVLRARICEHDVRPRALAGAALLLKRHQAPAL